MARHPTHTIHPPLPAHYLLPPVLRIHQTVSQGVSSRSSHLRTEQSVVSHLTVFRAKFLLPSTLPLLWPALKSRRTWYFRRSWELISLTHCLRQKARVVTLSPPSLLKMDRTKLQNKVNSYSATSLSWACGSVASARSPFHKEPCSKFTSVTRRQRSHISADTARRASHTPPNYVHMLSFMPVKSHLSAATVLVHLPEPPLWTIT